MPKSPITIALYLKPEAQQKAEAGASDKLEKLRRTRNRVRQLMNVIERDRDFSELSVGSRIVALTVRGSDMRKKIRSILKKYPDLTDQNPYRHPGNGDADLT